LATFNAQVINIQKQKRRDQSKKRERNKVNQ